MTGFKRYGSIENSYRQKITDLMFQEHSEGVEYVVLEKIHGANFSFYITQNDIKCAKRSGYLSEDDSFFNFQNTLSKHKENLFKLFNNISADFEEEVLEVVVNGELFGGIYPHSEVPKKDVKMVQKGVFYSNDIEFAAFDIKANGRLLDFEDFLRYVKNIPMAPALFRGSLEECLSFPNDEPTAVPEMLGLPKIKDNISEGIIIKPVKNRFFRQGNRVILKSKNERFREISGVREKRKSQKKVIIPDKVTMLIAESQNYTTENRLRNVLSHLGEVTEKDFGKILGNYSKDIFEDMSKDFEEIENLPTSERKMLTKEINKRAGVVIRKNLLDIVEGRM